MLHFLQLLFSTVWLRPYVFVFLLVYLLAATAHLGIRKTLVFACWAYLVAFLCEYSSTRNGFPFGYYCYLETTRDKEIWIAQVPFMDSLSFIFLAYISYSMALFFLSPLHISREDVFLLDTREERHALPTLVLAVVLFVLLDIVIDPLALRGDRWFLGQIYTYPSQGIYFGVPLTNFAGWILVGILILYPFQLLDYYWGERSWFRSGLRLYFPFSLLLGPLLYYAVVIFNIGITFWIGEYLLGLVGCFIHGPLALLFGLQFWKKKNRASLSDLRRHLEDFPSSPASRLIQAYSD